jgi:hypothetical protein
MITKIKRIKLRYRIIFIYLLISFLAFLLLIVYIEKRSKTIQIEIGTIGSLLWALWFAFLSLGIYLFVITFISIAGFVISKRMEKNEAKIAFRFLSYMMSLICMLFMIYWLVNR